MRTPRAFSLTAEEDTAGGLTPDAAEVDTAGV